MAYSFLAFAVSNSAHCFYKSPLCVESGSELVTQEGHRTLSLSAILEKHNKPGKLRVQRIVEFLILFHSEVVEEAKTSFLDEQDTLSMHSHRQRIQKLRSFFSGFASYIDPFSSLALSQIIAFLNGFYEASKEQFSKRAREGFIVNGCSDFLAKNIIFSSNGKESEVLVLNTESSSAENFIADLMNDLASLIVDLEVRGYEACKAVIINYYREQCSRFFNEELLRFYCVFNAIEQACGLLKGKGNPEKLDYTSYLKIAFQYAMNISSPFLLCITGAKKEQGEEIAEGLAQMLDINILNRDSVQSNVPFYFDIQRNIFNYLLAKIEEQINNMCSLVFIWDFETEEEAYDLTKLSVAYGVPIVFLDLHRSNSFEMDTLSSLSRLEQMCEFTGKISYLPLDVELSTPEFVMYTINHLRTGKTDLSTEMVL